MLNLRDPMPKARRAGGSQHIAGNSLLGTQPKMSLGFAPEGGPMNRVTIVGVAIGIAALTSSDVKE